jgi:hypothetical protein
VARRSSPHVTVRKSQAETRFHELVNELRVLTVAFPHLREAYDKNDLPVAFLLKRGADRAAARAGREQTKAATARKAARGRKA